MVFHQVPLRYRGVLDGSNSATVFASVTGTRWVLTNGFIGFQNASGVSNFSLIETYDSASSIFFNWNASNTSDNFAFNLGSVGVQGTITTTLPSGLKIAIDCSCTGTGSYTVVFSGYRTGGGY
jgi:hypothetical protein